MPQDTPVTRIKHLTFNKTGGGGGEDWKYHSSSSMQTSGEFPPAVDEAEQSAENNHQGALGQEDSFNPNSSLNSNQPRRLNKQFLPAESYQGNPGGASSSPRSMNLFNKLNNPKSAEPKNSKPKPKSFNSSNAANLSFSSVFNNQHQETTALKRVFRKSITFLILNLGLVGILIFLSINLFTINQNWLQNIFLTLFSTSLVVCFSNLFFVILADRKYLWLNLAGQTILLLFLHSLIGLGFSPLTLLVGVVVLMMNYLAYTELEKVQLGSRLFSIANITAESTRTLLTAAILLICLGIYNQIIFQGSSGGVYRDSSAFFSKTFLTRSELVDKILIGRGSMFSLNRFLLAGGFTAPTGTTSVRKPTTLGSSTTEPQNATLRDFLTANYEPNKLVFSEIENEDKVAECEAEKATDCDQQIQAIKDDRLIQWQQKAYPEIKYDLNTELDITKFRQLNRIYYTNLIKDFGETDTQSSSPIGTDFLIFSPKYILPAIFTFLIYVALSLVKPLLSWLVNFLMWLLWSILKATGYVQVEVETVEAEVVSI